MEKWTTWRRLHGGGLLRDTRMVSGSQQQRSRAVIRRRDAIGLRVGIQRRPLEQSSDVQVGAKRCANHNVGKRQGK